MPRTRSSTAFGFLSANEAEHGDHDAREVREHVLAGRDQFDVRALLLKDGPGRLTHRAAFDRAGRQCALRGVDAHFDDFDVGLVGLHDFEQPVPQRRVRTGAERLSGKLGRTVVLGAESLECVGGFAPAKNGASAGPAAGPFPRRRSRRRRARRCPWSARPESARDRRHRHRACQTRSAWIMFGPDSKVAGWKFSPACLSQPSPSATKICAAPITGMNPTRSGCCADAVAAHSTAIPVTIDLRKGMESPRFISLIRR